MYRVEADGARPFGEARWPWGWRQGPVGMSRLETDCVKMKECEQSWGEVVPGTVRRPQRRPYVLYHDDE